jgi:hypothetical protein
MLPVAIRAARFQGIDLLDYRFVSRDIHRICCVTTRTKRSDLCFGKHDIRRREGIFIGKMRGRGAVALRTSDVGPRVDRRQHLLLEVHMTFKAKAVIGNGPGRGIDFHCGNHFLFLRSLLVRSRLLFN